MKISIISHLICRIKGYAQKEGNIPDQNKESGVDTVPNSDESGNPVVNNQVQSEKITDEIKRAIEHPSILEILRSIR